MTKRIGIIGGSGLYKMEGLTLLNEIELDTPFGKPSAPYMISKLEGSELHNNISPMR